MRIRSIKPEFWRSGDISSIDDWNARFLFIGLWSYVDDNGVGEDRLSRITSDLFADDLERDPSETFARVSRGLQTLSAAGRITRYTAENKDFLHITNWSRHQRIDRPNKARFPLPTSSNAEIRDTLATPSCNPIVGSSGSREQGNRGTGDQGSEGSDVPMPPEPDDDEHEPREIGTGARPTKPAKASSTELSFIRLHVGQQLPRDIEAQLVAEVRKLRTFDTPVIESALRNWATRDCSPKLLSNLVSDELKRRRTPQGARPAGPATAKATGWLQIAHDATQSDDQKAIGQ